MLYREYGTIERLEHSIDAHLNDSEFSIDLLCKEVGISRSQLHRIIKEKTNLSITLYLRKKRLEKAKLLLSSTDLRVSEIADAVGINNPANFSKYFIEEFQMSPTDFRKQQQTDLTEVLTVIPPLHHQQEDWVKNPPGRKPNLPSRYVYVLVGIAAILAVAFYFFGYRFSNESIQNSTSLQEVSENTIAILPFKNLGPTEKSFFSDGVMEQIHASLSLLENLKVISKSSSKLFRDSPKPLSQIANELHVKYILEGSVLQIDQKIRITVELSNAAENRAVWTQSYDGETKEVFTFMSKVAKEVADELNQKLNAELTDKITKSPTKSLAAYNEYLQGNQLIQARDKSKLEASLLKFTAAIELDPEFANAYANRASAYFLMVAGKYIDEQTGYKMAEQNALTSIRLDAENSLAYAVLAIIYQDQNKWDQARTTYQIALKYSPNDALINYWYSLMLRSLGHLEEAIQFSTKAVESDPLSQVIFGGHTLNCILGGKLDLAQKNISDAQLLFNNTWNYHFVKGYYHISKEEYTTALQSMNRAIELGPSIKILKHMATYCKSKAGQTKEVTDYLKSLADVPENYSAFIMLYAGLGDKERAMRYLQKMADTGVIPTDLKVMPIYKTLRNDKRYEAILQKYGLLSPDISTQ
jgi:TolB-like protein/AraC-like DNA-binding protein/Tfp pilus assembly protein PilF